MTGEGSYVSGLGTQPLIGDTIGRHFDAIVAEHGARLALVVADQEVHWDYRALAARVDAVATALLDLGLAPGDRLGIWSHNCAEWTVIQFATAKIGVILVNINPAYRAAELEFVLHKVGCKALVIADRFKTSDYPALLREVAPELDGAAPNALHATRLPALRLVIALGRAAQDGCLPFERLLQTAPDRARLDAVGAALSFDDPINIQFTSGTTGFPKGATLTHHNILNNGFFVGETIGLGPDSRVCIPVPLYHCFGMVMGNLACLTHGCAMVYPGAGFDPAASLAAVERYRCDALYGVPTMFIAMLDHPAFAGFGLGSLRTGIMAGSPCPIEVMRRVVDQLGMREVTIAYGMTETSPVSFQSHRTDGIERRVTTVGRVHPHLEMKAIDADGRIVPRGTPGELCTRGYSVMQGYWDEPARTAEVLDRAGWMHTGDLGVIDAEGFCTIVGRIKDMVIRGGENIYPREIEEFLHGHPAVQDVQVIGVPDARHGEELMALVIRRPGAALDEEGVRAFCRGRIAHYKVPRHVRFMDAFPLTVTGKVKKFELREQVVAELGQRAAASA